MHFNMIKKKKTAYTNVGSLTASQAPRRYRERKEGVTSDLI